jgi:hypothetical protein
MGSLASELRSIANGITGAPRVYVDANIPAGAVAVMRHELHWDALFVIEHDDLRRASDASHFSRAIELGRTLLTQDRDFLDDGRFPPSLTPGVIVCAVTDEATLIRLLRYIDRRWLGASAPKDEPLTGRKIVLTSEVLWPCS